MPKQVFNFKEWGIGEWAAAASIAYLVYTAVRDNERARVEPTARELWLDRERERMQIEARLSDARDRSV